MYVFPKTANGRLDELHSPDQGDTLVDVEVFDRIPNDLSREVVESRPAGCDGGLGDGIVVVHSATNEPARHRRIEGQDRISLFVLVLVQRMKVTIGGVLEGGYTVSFED